MPQKKPRIGHVYGLKCSNQVWKCLNSCAYLADLILEFLHRDIIKLCPTTDVASPTCSEARRLAIIREFDMFFYSLRLNSFHVKFPCVWGLLNCCGMTGIKHCLLLENNHLLHCVTPHHPNMDHLPITTQPEMFYFNIINNHKPALDIYTHPDTHKSIQLHWVLKTLSTIVIQYSASLNVH